MGAQNEHAVLQSKFGLSVFGAFSRILFLGSFRRFLAYFIVLKCFRRFYLYKSDDYQRFRVNPDKRDDYHISLFTLGIQAGVISTDCIS